MQQENYVILCIDDESIILESLSMELEEKFEGVELEFLEDGTEAEELVEELMNEGKKIAVVICDYIMPKQKGDEVLAVIHKLSPNTKNVMLTGQSSFNGVTNAINKANLYRYISKPWDKDDFLLTIKGAFDSYIQQETIEKQNKELKELNESLEQKVIERTQELMDANRKNNEYLEIIDKYVIISRIDTNGIVTYASGAFCKKSGFTKNEIIGKNYWETLYADLEKEDIQGILKTIHSGFSWVGEMKHKSKDGSYYWVHEIITPNIQEESIILGFTSIRQDITDKKAVEALSITDELTKLYNRRYFKLVMDREINRAKRDSNTLAFFMLDIDHFKLYNDTYGHVSGDAVLQKVATVFKSMFQRGADFCFRMGGEEFSLLLEVKDGNEASLIASMILEEIQNLKIFHEKNSTGKYVSISIGIHIVNPYGDTLTTEEVYQKADEKLYIAKESGRNCFII